MILLSILLQATAAAAPIPTADDALTTYRERTRADVTCRVKAGSEDVLVCGRREADRYRVPFETVGAPQVFSAAQRAATLRVKSPCEEKGPFLIGCGAAGVTASTTFGPGEGSGVQVGGYRPIAP